MKQADSNADRMLVSSPLPGIAVIKTTWKNGGNMVEFTEGDEVRSGVSRSSRSSTRPSCGCGPASTRPTSTTCASARSSGSDSTRIRTCRSPAPSRRFRRSASSPRCRRRCVTSSCWSLVRGAHPEPDARPHLVPRRRARADARARWSCRATPSASKESRPTSMVQRGAAITAAAMSCSAARARTKRSSPAASQEGVIVVEERGDVRRRHEAAMSSVRMPAPRSAASPPWPSS